MKVEPKNDTILKVTGAALKPTKHRVLSIKQLLEIQELHVLPA